jgi:hypothetical protein
MVSTTISMLIAGILVGIVGAVIAVIILFDHTGGKPWFYWIAPLLAIGFAFMMIQLAVAYWVKVGKLETKGRPKK